MGLIDGSATRDLNVVETEGDDLLGPSVSTTYSVLMLFFTCLELHILVCCGQSLGIYDRTTRAGRAGCCSGLIMHELEVG